MPSFYPGGLDSLSTSHQDNVNEVIHASDIDNLADAVNKIEATLGINPHQGSLPAGTFSDLVSRLNAIDVPSFKEITPPYTLILSDLSVILDLNNSTAANLTIPANASVAFPVGSSITFRVTAAGGTTTFVGATGVTVRSLGGLVNTAGAFALVTALKVSTDIWNLYGNLA